MAPDGSPRRVKPAAPPRAAPYPGAPLDLSADPSLRARREADRCHVLPEKSGVRVMTQGVFDILHLGHLHYFEAARALGDELVVIIARDETVARNKHAPIFGEEARCEMVAALDPVDYAVVGHSGDFYRVVEELEPDVICIGYDQPYKEAAIEAECARRGVPVRVVRLHHMDYDLDSTRKVVEAIAERLARHELYAKATPDEQRRLEELGVAIAAAPKKVPSAAAEAVNNPPPSTRSRAVPKPRAARRTSAVRKGGKRTGKGGRA